MDVLSAGAVDDAAVPEDLAGAALALARRLAAGATLWCVAPQWPAPGPHVAAALAPPVVVAKPALPAVNVEGPEMVATVRVSSRPGDVLLVVSPAADPAARDILRRAEAWGLTRIWLGGGPRPLTGLAEHVVWCEALEPSLAAQSAALVLLYHRLWEQAHTAFEQPSLLEAGPATVCTDEVCITCSDEARVAEVTAVASGGQAEVVVRGRRETVDASLVDAGPGDLLLVHAGVAISLLGPSVA